MGDKCRTSSQRGVAVSQVCVYYHYTHAATHVCHRSLRDPRRMGRNIDAEEEDYFNADDDESDNHAPQIPSQVGGHDLCDENPPFISPHLRGRSSSPVHTTLKRKRRGALVGKGFRPQALLLPRTPPLKSLVDYPDEDDWEEIGPPSPPVPPAQISKTAPMGNPRSSPLSPSVDIPPSPKLPHRQVSSRPQPLPRRSSLDEEDNLLESLLRSKSISPSPSSISKARSKPSIPPTRLGDKRRREDDDEQQLDILASKPKRPDLGPRKDLVPSSGISNAVKSGDDPPKKFKLALRSSSIVTALSQSSTPVSSKPGAKDGDTG